MLCVPALRGVFFWEFLIDHGWIKLHRKLMNWEWYHNSEMVHLFIHLLLSANHKDRTWQGIDVKRGQAVVGRRKLRKDTGLSEQTIRTSLKRLKSTHEITIKPTHRFSIITLCQYEEYNSEISEANPLDNPQINQQLTSNQPATNQQLTTNKNVKKDKNDKNDKKKDICNTFVAYWNSKKALPNIRAFNGSRADKLMVRMKEEVFKDSWKEAVDKVAASPFCLGQTGGSWRVDASWFLANSDNYVKVLEGKYDGVKPEDEEAKRKREHEALLETRRRAGVEC